eukprot:15455284-Alexandrium_andersonii.AAC.1
MPRPPACHGRWLPSADPSRHCATPHNPGHSSGRLRSPVATVTPGHAGAPGQAPLLGRHAHISERASAL